MKRILVILGWCLAVFLQGGSGYLMGCLLSGRPAFPLMGMIPFPMTFWAGISLGVFVVGITILAARKQFQTRDLLPRLALTAAGAFISVITTQFWSSIRFGPMPLSGFTGALIMFLVYANIHESILLGLIGFYLADWMKIKKKEIVS
jgi:hypothetical protein